MKRFVLILCALFFVQFSNIIRAEEQRNILIVKKKDSEDVPKQRPRDLIQVPIACFYSNGSLFFTFMEDLGELEISVTKLDTGTEIFDEIDSFCGNALLEVPESSGEYQIEITTENGDSYYGEYTL